MGLRKSLSIPQSWIREGIAEFAGTFILVLIGDASVAQSVLSDGASGNVVSISLAWAVAIIAGVAVAGGTSGAHINPAVTIALAVLRKVRWSVVPIYIFSQLLGAFVASAVLFGVYSDALHEIAGGLDNRTAGIWATYPQSYLSTECAFAEQVFPFNFSTKIALLVIGILALCDQRNMGVPKHLLPLYIGLLVMGLCQAFGLYAGNAMNPARDFAPRLFTAIAGWGADVFMWYWWIPIVAPIAGGVVGALLYDFLIGLQLEFNAKPIKDIESSTSSTVSITGMDNHNGYVKGEEDSTRHP